MVFIFSALHHFPNSPEEMSVGYFQDSVRTPFTAVAFECRTHA